MKKSNIGAAAAFTGAAVNLALFFVKLYVAVSCNSLSIYLDSFNNGIDSLVCVGVGLGFILSKKETVKSYPFGFGKTEGVVNFLVSVIILITGLSFGYSSVIRIMYPLRIFYTSKYALMLLVTVPVKLLLLLFYRHSNKKLGSEVFKSLSLDSVIDSLITLFSFTAFVLSQKLDFSADGIAGLIISAVMIAQGVKIVKESFGFLIGKRDNILCEKIENAVKESNPDISVSNIQCHIYGERRVATMTVVPNETESLEELVCSLENTLVPDTVSEIYINIGDEKND